MLQRLPPRSEKTAAPAIPAEARDLGALVDGVTRLARNVRAENPLHILEKSGRLLLAGDVAALVAAFIVGGFAAWASNIYVLHDTFQHIISFDTLYQLSLFAVLGVMAILWLDANGHYRQRLPYWEMVGQILAITFIGFILGGFVQFAAKNAYSRLWLGFSWSFFACFIFMGRVYVRHYLQKRGRWMIPALLIGEGPTADAALRALLSEKEMGFFIIDRVGPEKITQHAWKQAMGKVKAGHIFLALEGSQLETSQGLLKSLARAKVPFSIVPPWIGLPGGTLSAHYFMMQDVLILNNVNPLDRTLPRFIKRSFDVMVACALLVLLSPLLGLIALGVRRDGGAAFFRQRRIGMHGKPFYCYKFRSMRVDAEAMLKKHLASNPAAANEWKRFQKLKKDPRITRFGAFLRRHSLDELPQLINVLKGEMSLVGPRPIMPEQQTLYREDLSYYESVRPGITGPWQVSGRSSRTFRERVNLESWYVRNWSPWMDIVILIKTVPVLLKKNGAY